MTRSESENQSLGLFKSKAPPSPPRSRKWIVPLVGEKVAAGCLAGFLAPVMMGARRTMARSHAPSLSVLVTILLVTMVMVEGQEEEEGREGRKLVLKKVRRKQPQPIGQCPQVRCSPGLRWEWQHINFQDTRDLLSKITSDDQYDRVPPHVLMECG